MDSIFMAYTVFDVEEVNQIKKFKVKTGKHPTKIKSEVSNTGSLVNVYTATGAKVRKMVYADNFYGSEKTSDRIDYAGKAVYKGSKLQFIQTGEGRIAYDAENGNFTWQYDMKDHLGNIRAVISQLAPGQPVVMQETHYYPFGLEMPEMGSGLSRDEQPYLYNGKESVNDLDLGWYDYGSRMYDPALGRWHCVDPQAERYSWMSPYSYVANNPMILIDPNGEEITFIPQYNDDGELVGLTMQVTGKVINVSGKSVDMDKAASDIASYMKSTFKSDDDGFSFNTEVNLTVAESMDDVEESDHVFALAEFDDVGYFEAGQDGATKDYSGATASNKVAYLDVELFRGPYDVNIGNGGERSASHEVLHMFRGSFSHRNISGNLEKQGGSGNALTQKQLKQLHNIGEKVNRGTPFMMGGQLYYPNDREFRSIVKVSGGALERTASQKQYLNQLKKMKGQ